jgi:polysaccharide biosynthesis transport protein
MLKKKLVYIPLFLVNGLIIGAASLSWFLLPRAYDSSFAIVIPDRSGTVNTNLGNVNSIQETQPAFSQQVETQTRILLSEGVSKMLLAKAVPQEGSPAERARALNQLQKAIGSIKIKPVANSNILTVTVSDRSPLEAQKLSALLLQAYQIKLKQLRNADLQERAALYDDPLRKAALALEKAETNLARFKMKSGLVSADEQVRSSIGSMANLINAQAMAISGQKQAAARTQALNARLGTTPARAIESLRLSSYSPYLKARADLDEVERNLTNARAYFTEDSPRVSSLLDRRQKLQELVESRVQEVAGKNADGTVDSTRMGLIGQMITAEAESEAMRQGAANLEKRLASMERSVRGMGPNQVELARYQRRFMVAEVAFQALTAQAQRTRLDMFSRYPNVQILEPPGLSASPSSPKLLFFIIGTFLSSVLASVALLVRARRLAPPITERDLKELGMPIITRIPAIYPTPKVHFQWLASLLPQDLKVLMVTSSTSGEGKSYITKCLAHVLSTSGYSVLLLDADFAKVSKRKGRKVKVSEQVNLTDFTPGSHQSVPSAQVKVSSIRELQELVAAGRNIYDWVLIDTGPIQLTADAVAILKFVPNVLFVVREGYVSYPLVANSINLLRQMDLNLVGCVFNGAKELAGIGNGAYYASERLVGVTSDKQFQLPSPSGQSKATDEDG